MAIADLCHKADESTAPEWNPSKENYWWRPKDDGLFPDGSQLQPGDILLFRPLKPDLLQKRIIKRQRRFCLDWEQPEEHALYTHSAVYLGYDGLLCEAVWPRAQLSCVDEKIENQCIKVRRVSGLSRQQQGKLAEAAASLRSRRYGWEKLVELQFKRTSLKQRLPGVRAEDEQRSLICSTLCSRALLHVGVAVLPPDQRIVVPAYLSLTEKLTDVTTVGWCRYTRVVRGPASDEVTTEPTD